MSLAPLITPNLLTLKTKLFSSYALKIIKSVFESRFIINFFGMKSKRTAQRFYIFSGRHVIVLGVEILNIPEKQLHV